MPFNLSQSLADFKVLDKKAWIKRVWFFLTKTKPGRFWLFLVVLALLGAAYAINSWLAVKASLETDSIREVKVIRLADLGNSRGDLPLIGQVSSQSQVTIQAEAQGQVAHLYHEVGDSVGAGEEIAELENASQRAGVLQAEAGLASAKAQLGSGQNSAVEAKHNLYNAIKSAYSVADDAVYNHADKLFVDPNSSAVFQTVINDGGTQLTFKATDANLAYELSVSRHNIGASLKAWSADTLKLQESDDLSLAVAEAQTNLELVRNFLDQLSQGVNSFSSFDYRYKAAVDGMKADISGTRGTINSTIAGLIAAADQAQAKQSLGQGSGANISINAASVKQAEANWLLAQSALRKTIIRAPIAGTINSLNLKLGNFVSMYQPLVTIANNNALEIVTYVSDTDKSDLSLGSTVLVENRLPATISSIAPALDPATGKIQIKIALTQDSPILTNGQTVSLLLHREGLKNIPTVTATGTAQIIIPLSALKVEPDRLVVFSVGPERKLVAHEVKEGPIFSDKIGVYADLDPALEIVLDARGLKPGQTVIIKK